MMDIQEKRLLEETAALAKENNKLIKKIRRGMITGRVVRIFYWVVIIGISVGAFYFLQPYVEGIRGIYEDLQGAQNQVNTLFNFFGNGEENSVE